MQVYKFCYAFSQEELIPSNDSVQLKELFVEKFEGSVVYRCVIS
jgi:hypothetical protein